MTIPRLAVYGFGYNLNRIKYPWKASLNSAIILASWAYNAHEDFPPPVYFCECYSTDDTWKEISESPELARWEGDILGYHHTWEGDCRVQVDIANMLLDEIEKSGYFDYALKIDMDEVLCEWTFRQFWEQLCWMHDHKVVLGKPRYVHFCPDDKTTFPFIYQSKAVLSRVDAHLRYHDNDACALGGNGVPEFQTNLLIHHYGKMEMGREEAALHKERTFTQKYKHLGFPDPKVEAQADQGYLDYMRVFDVAKSKGEFHAYDGPHPIYVQDWLTERRKDSQEFWEERGGKRE